MKKEKPVVNWICVNNKQWDFSVGLKNNSKPLLYPIIDLIPRHVLQQCILKYRSDKYCSRYKTYDQLVSQMFGQLNKCLTLEDISAGIGVSETFIRDLGLVQSPARSTMSDGNKKRNWQVFEQLFHKLLAHYGRVLVARHHYHVIEEIKHKIVRINDSNTASTIMVEEKGYYDFEPIVS